MMKQKLILEKYQKSNKVNLSNVYPQQRVILEKNTYKSQNINLISPTP